MSVSRLAASLLLLGTLLIGFAHIAALPPWEGFDETAHYSYIQQLAETGRWPRFGEPMSRDIDAYHETIPALGHPPWNYPALFAAPADVIDKARTLIKQPPTQARSWRPGETVNWEAQHPPLYYALMAPAYWLSKGWSLAHQLALLRGFSYLLAWAGLCIAATASLGAERKGEPLALLSIGLWPVVFPMWFPEMARIGNDSLLVVLAACAMLLVRRIALGAGRARHYALLGLIVGAALLTKATFLPFAAAIGAILLFRLYRAREDRPGLIHQLKCLVILGVIALAVCGWWYAGKFIETGSLIGSNDLAHLNVNSAPAQPRIDLFARLPWLFAQSFLWFGTWSSVLPPRILAYLLAATTALLAFGACRWIVHRGVGAVGALALLTLAGFLAALTYLTVMSAGGTGGAAWYLHAFAPVLAPLLGFGIAGMMDTKPGRVALGVVLVFPLGFLVVATAVDLLYFAGCGAKLPVSMYYDLASGARCAGDFATLYRNLDAVAFPGFFLPLFVTGWLLCLAGVIVALRSLHGGDQASITSTR